MEEVITPQDTKVIETPTQDVTRDPNPTQVIETPKEVTNTSNETKVATDAEQPIIEQPSFINEDTDKDTLETLSSITTNASSEESIKNIEYSNIVGLSHDEFGDASKSLMPEIELRSRIPAQVSPGVNKILRTSEQTANALKDDIGWLGKIENQVDYILYNVYGKREQDNKILDLEERYAKGELKPHEIEFLNRQHEKKAKREQAFNLGSWEQIPGQIAGVAGDAAEAIVSNVPEIAIASATGAALGSILPGLTTIPAGLATLGTATVAAFGKDQFRRVKGFSQGELRTMKDETGKPLNLSFDKVNNISTGIAFFSAVAEMVSGKVLTGTIKKFATSKVAVQTLTKSPLLRASIDMVGNAMKVGGVNVAEEIPSELVAMFGEAIAKTDGSEEALSNAMQVFAKDVLSKKGAERLAITGIVALGGGGLTSVATTAPFVPKLAKGYEANNKVLIQRRDNINKYHVEATQAINAQNDFAKLIRLVDQTKANKTSPQVMDAVVGRMMQDAGIEQRVWISQEDVETLIKNNPEVEKTLNDLNITNSNNTGAPKGMILHEFLPLVKGGIPIDEYMRLYPEAPNPLESKVFLERYENVKKQQEAILNESEETRLKRIDEVIKARDAELTKKSVNGVIQPKTKEKVLAKYNKKIEDINFNYELSPEQSERMERLNKEIEESIITGEESYLNAPLLTENIEGAIPDKKLESFNEAHKRARQVVKNKIDEQFQKSEVREENRLARQEEKTLKRNELNDLSKEIEILENFKYKKNWPVEGHKKKGYTVYAIDPKTLPDNLREAYVTDPMLIKRKVFVEGGKSADESAALMGIESGEELLRILANAPTKEELVNSRAQKLKEFKKSIREEQFETAPERIDELYKDKTKLHKMESDYLRSEERAAFGTGVKIVLPLPNIPELQLTAKKVIANTKVNELNPRQYNAGENAAQRKFLTSMLKNEVEKASVAKEQAVLNMELTKESLKVRDKISKARVTLKRITSPKTIALFKKTGLTDDVNKILDVFDLNDKVSQKNRNLQQAQIEFIKKVEASDQNTIIPSTLTDIRRSGSDLTTEEFLRVTDMLTTYEHQAKEVNKLNRKLERDEKAAKIQTVEAIATEGALDLKENHVDFDIKKLRQVKNRNSKTQTQKNTEGFSLNSALLTNFKNVATQLDRDKLGGIHYNNLAQPIINGEHYKRSKNFQLVKHIKNIAKAYGDKEFKAAFNEEIYIEEFKDIAELGFGTMMKSDLWLLLAYVGDPQGRERISNFKFFNEEVVNGEVEKEVGAVDVDVEAEGIDYNVVLKALEKHLSEKDADLVQNFVNINKSFEEESKQLHYRFTGVMPDMIKPAPYEFKGKMREGGYVNLNYLNISPEQEATRFLAVLGDQDLTQFGDLNEAKNNGKLYSRLKAAEQTDQGRMNDRIGSKKALDTDFRSLLHSYEEVIHDLAYREVGTDTLKLLRDKTYSNAIIATVGEAKYKTMVNGVIETVGNIDEHDTLNPFRKEAGQIRKYYRALEQRFNVHVLGFNPTSVLMQPLSLFAARTRMGKHGAAYISKALGTILANPSKYGEIFNRAGEINNDILTGRDSIDDTVIKSLFKDIPKSERNRYFGSRNLKLLNEGIDKMAEISMMGLTTTDIHIKAMVTMAAYAQFMDGNVENFPMSKLDKMTETERETKAKQYVKQIADLSLTTSAMIDKSAIEKVELLRFATRFYTDRRAQLNTGLAEVRKVKYEVKKGIKAYKTGNEQQALTHAKEAIQMSAWLMSSMLMYQLYDDLIHLKDNPIKDLTKVKSGRDFGDYIGNTIKYVATAPLQATASTALIASDIQHAVQSTFGNKQVNAPITQTFTNMARGIVAVGDLVQLKGISKSEFAGLSFTASLFLKNGIPISGPQKMWKFSNDVGLTTAALRGVGGAAGFIMEQSARTSNLITEYISNNKDKPSEQAFIKELEEYQKTIPVVTDENVESKIPEDAMDVLKTNEWDDENPDTGAAGIYQFTEERWNEIGEENPELALSDNGRVSKDIREQERAMDWELKEHTKELSAYRIPVDNTSLFGAHRFGIDNYVMIALSKGNKKLKDVVKDMTLFKGFKTTNQVKSYITRELNKGK